MKERRCHFNTINLMFQRLSVFPLQILLIITENVLKDKSNISGSLKRESSQGIGKDTNEPLRRIIARDGNVKSTRKVSSDHKGSGTSVLSGSTFEVTSNILEGDFEFGDTTLAVTTMLILAKKKIGRMKEILRYILILHWKARHLFSFLKNHRIRMLFLSPRNQERVNLVLLLGKRLVKVPALNIYGPQRLSRRTQHWSHYSFFKLFQTRKV